MSELNGLRVLNTRPSKQGEALNQAIRDAGGLPIDLPALLIEPTPHDWLPQLPALASIQHALFISANAVDYFFARLTEAAMPWPAGICVTAMGTATAAALSQQRIQVHQVPAIADSEHLLTLDALQQIENDTVLLIKGASGRTLITETLLARRARLISLDVYRTQPPLFDRTEINSLWQDDALDIILFTSEQAMRNLLDAFAGKGQSWFCSKPCLVISERLATVGASLGMKCIHLCHHDTILTALKGFKHD
ncbi:MAG TPA: uroporphyrinogen-III synthase [Legionella sp.]|nr:uroporphyrinogen-III synthase [Legionella sp.]